ncbi:MAG: 8-oxo-dGTP diphosphatase [Lachnospiraceae bacterium]|nr:8-oxo-dGTP diphosphatase [Lachnospiraceae bacterium]
MLQTTLCYIEKEDRYLLLHRVSKKNDANKDKWIGIGGKFEDKESPEDCLLREAKEETGLTLTSYRLRGIVTFVSNEYPTEYMFLYTADGYEGELGACKEGTLEWIKKKDMYSLNLWEGDKIFLKLLEEEHPFFSLKLSYEGDLLVQAVLEGKEMKLPYL